MYILRVEQLDGSGVYQNGFMRKLGIPNDQRYHPAPWDDRRIRGVFNSGAHHFGFAGIRTYLQWFYKPEWRAWLDEAGATLKVYQVDESLVECGGSQVVFIKHKATLIFSLPTDIFDLPNWTNKFSQVNEVLNHAS